MARRFVVALLLAFAAAHRPAAALEPGVVARVNGAPITAQRLERFFEDRLAEKGRAVASIRSPAAYAALRREALDRLVDAEVLWQEAQRAGLLATRAEVEAALAEVRAGFTRPGAFERRLERGGFDEETYREHLRRQVSIRKLVQRDVVAKVTVSDAEIRAHYEAHPERFSAPEQVRARHILARVAPGAGEDERGKARARIEAAEVRLREGAPFAEVARELSEDGTAADGGDLGFFGRGQMVPAFEAAAFALAPGERSGVVETQFGLHLIAVEARRGGERIPEAEVRGSIRELLSAEKAEAALTERIRALRGQARIELAAR